jgi:futalosine hydrolase
MYILLVAATHNELNTTIDWLRQRNGMMNSHEVEVLITGIGSAATSYALTRQLLYRSPELVIQAGIGGSFRESLPPESVVLVSEEVFADLGAYQDGEFTDIFDLGLADSNELPFTNRILVNPGLDMFRKFGLEMVRGATINCISSTPAQVNTIIQKYNPVVESMEGAALHYCCLMENIPFIQLRVVSNFAGERNKNNWKLKEAISILNDRIKKMIAVL